MRTLLCLFVLLLATPALAGEPDLVWEDDGTLRATVVFDAPIAKVKALLADPKKSVALSPDVKSVDIAPKGECHQLTVTTTGVTDPFQYVSLRCPTADGVKDEMISSEDYEVQWAVWTLTAQGDKTQGVLRSRTKLKMWVPERFVRGGIKKGVKRTIAAMQENLSGG